MPDYTSGTYSETDASNNAASPNGMPEGMAPSGLNDAWRAGMGGALRTFHRDHGGSWCTVGGTANALTLTYAVNPVGYVQGEKFTFKATANNTTATTIAVGGLAPIACFKKTLAGAAACSGGEIFTGDIVEVEFDGTNFQLLNPSPPGVFPVVISATTLAWANGADVVGTNALGNLTVSASAPSGGVNNDIWFQTT